MIRRTFEIHDSGGRARTVPVFSPARSGLENVGDPVTVRRRLFPEKENARRFVLTPLSEQPLLLDQLFTFYTISLAMSLGSLHGGGEISRVCGV